MSVHTYRVGDVRLTRIGYVDVSVPAAIVGLTPEQVAAVPWAEPLWTDAEGVRAGAAAWIIESGDARIVVDPAQAADDILRSDDVAATQQQIFAGLMQDAGFPRETITHALTTHVEGIGMFGWRNDDGTWSPFFPNAPWIVPPRDLDAIDDGSWKQNSTPALVELRAQGAVVGSDAPVTDEVTVEHTGTHAPGHRVIRIDSNGEHAVMLGHLALSPLHLATGECPQQHFDPSGAEAVLARVRNEDALLIGPLWPAPGAGYWRDGAFTPATPR